MTEWDHQPRVKAFANYLRLVIPTLPSDKKASSEIAAMELPELLVTYLNWADRFVVPRKRAISHHINFWDGAAIKNETVIRSIAEDIEVGADINDRISKRVKSHGYLSRNYLAKYKKARWYLKDTVLNSHGVHHLHLGSVSKERSDDLLFVSFTRSEACLIGVGTHADFDTGRISQRAAEIHSNRRELKGISAPRVDTCPKAKARLERAGFGTTYTVDNKVVIGAMQTTSGHCLEHVRLADRICSILDNLDHQLDDPGQRAEFLNDFPTAPPVEELSWRMNGCDLLLFHEKTQAALTFRELMWCR